MRSPRLHPRAKTQRPIWGEVCARAAAASSAVLRLQGELAEGVRGYVLQYCSGQLCLREFRVPGFGFRVPGETTLR